MAVGDLITAARFNNLQSRIATIQGNGSGSDGYGQTLASDQALASATVTAADMQGLYLDMSRARTHQTGIVPTQIQSINVADLIIDDDTSPYVDKAVSAFESLMLNIEADRFQINDSQASLTAGVTSTRETGWSGNLQHEVEVTFENADGARHFFNSGGQLRFYSTLSGGSELKTDDWRVILNNAGTVQFKYNTTASSGSGQAYGVGFYDLTTTYQLIYQKVGSDVNAAYAENRYTIAAKKQNNSVIKFLISYRDEDTGDSPVLPVPPGGIVGGVDESVDGILKSIIQVYRATGPSVEVEAPNLFNSIIL
jgi:hypothetical protein